VTLAIVLLIVAFALLSIELMIPSFGLFGLMAGTSYAFSISLAFEEGSNVGWTIVGVGILLAPVAVSLGLKLLPKTPIGRRLLLSEPNEASIQRGTQSTARARFLGKQGVTITDLRPAGVALFEDEKLDVVSVGGFVPKNTSVTLIAIEGMRAVVQSTSNEPITHKDSNL
jgi:membrane-bound serine protease (ClpP class)